VLRRQLLTFVIAGGGPTGVELAGALAEISRHALARDFQNIDPTQARIILVEGNHHLLSAYPKALALRARQELTRLGVELREGVRVTHIDETGVFVGDEHIPARTRLWAAGVAASPLGRSLGVALDHAGRVPVSPELTLPGRKDVFVIGDLAAFQQDGHPTPGVAPAAMQEGKHAADNILRQLKGKPMEPFRYNDRGMFSVIGRGAAVGVAMGRFQLSGYPAWLAWLFIHVLFLVGFRSKLAVLLNWAYSYLAFRRSARIITGTIPLLPHLPTPPGATGDGQAPRGEVVPHPGAS
jgi:NADH:ubiquinone reductase (H+-translocating)